MKRIVSISEIVDSREMMKGTRDVIAAVNAALDESKSVLVVECSAYAIMTDVRGHETRLPEEWLPKNETIREHIAPEEAQSLARELFHRWAAKVRASVPSPPQPVLA